MKKINNINIANNNTENNEIKTEAITKKIFININNQNNTNNIEEKKKNEVLNKVSKEENKNGNQPISNKTN